MCGTRGATKLWQAAIWIKLEPDGFVQLDAIAGFYFHPMHTIGLVAHGDGLLADTEPEDMNWLDECMNRCFLTRRVARVGLVRRRRVRDA